MPIEVQHGGQGYTGIGQILASAGQRDLDRQQQSQMMSERLTQQRNMQMAQIDAQSDRQRQSADDAFAMTAMKAGLSEHMQEAEFGRAMQAKQEEARERANQWEYQYTAKQRQDISKFNNARQTVESSNSFSQAEKESALRAIDIQQAGIKPSMMPRDPNKQQFPEGQGIGATWVEENGSTFARTKDGDVKLMIRPDQTKEYLAEKTAAAYKTKVFEMRMKLATEKVDELDSAGEQIGQRFRTQEEIGTIMQLATGEQQQQQQPQQQQQEQQPQFAQPLSERLTAMGGIIKKEDAGLPEDVQAAAAMVRGISKRYGGRGNIPKKSLSTYDKYINVLKGYSK